MNYKFIVLADIHWGAMDSSLTYNNLELVLEFIKQMKNELDFIIIAGDYFDYRIQLNSKTALLAVKWFDRLINTCKESNVKKVRMFKGTREHDNDQLEVFRAPYETENGFFKLFNTTESEELLPDLRCVYCPDENINLNEYHNLYYNKFIPNPNIGFFHGNFDAILPSIEFNRIQEHNLPTMIYEYSKFAKLIKGPLISGHWHIKNNYKDLYYVGSYDRWKFNEEDDKGFIYGEINTESSEYFLHFVRNPLARDYTTIMVTSSEVNTPEDFAKVSDSINSILKESPETMIRVVYIIEDESVDQMSYSILQRKYATNKHVKFTVKDLIKRSERKMEKKKVKIEASKYNYIFNSDIKSVPNIIHQFILDNKNVEVPVDIIQKYVNKYI